MHDKKRRDFIKLGSATLCGAGLGLGANPLAALAQAAAAGQDDYRALVCIYLSGGSDGFNLLVPTDQAEFNEYQQSRQHLTPDQFGLLPLRASNSDIPNCGLNQQAVALEPLYNEGRLAFIGNVGILIEPTSKEQYENKSVAIPPQLFSHNDQEIQWQQLQGQLTSQNGWGALAARHLNMQQEHDYLTSVTLAGSNHWQSSETERPFSIEADGVVQYKGMSNLQSKWQDPRRDAFNTALQQSHSHLLVQAYAELQQRAASITAELGAAIATAPVFSTEKPAENSLADSLKMVARLISLQSQLGMSRQIFYVDMKGWDVHDSQATEQPDLFRTLAEGMAYFQSCMDEIDQSDNVTAFTASDFGRTLSGNGDGTDHGWGNHHMVMGGAVAGANIYGSIPRLAVKGPDAVRNGRVIPGLSATQYASTLLRWIGLDDNALDQVLPTLKNFQQRDLGFFV